RRMLTSRRRRLTEYEVTAWTPRPARSRPRTAKTARSVVRKCSAASDSHRSRSTGATASTAWSGSTEAIASLTEDAIALGSDALRTISVTGDHETPATLF